MKIKITIDGDKGGYEAIAENDYRARNIGSYRWAEGGLSRSRPAALRSLIKFCHAVVEEAEKGLKK